MVRFYNLFFCINFDLDLTADDVDSMRNNLKLSSAVRLQATFIFNLKKNIMFIFMVHINSSVNCWVLYKVFF